jgi:hypothetical protein
VAAGDARELLRRPRLPRRPEQGRGLFEGQRLAGTAVSSLGRVDQGGHIPGYEVIRLRVPDRTLQAQPGDADRLGRVRPGQAGQCRADIGCRQFGEDLSSQLVEHWFEDVPVLRQGLGRAAVHAVAEPVLDRQRERVIPGHADRLGKLLVQGLELVFHLLLGRAADNPADAPAIRAVTEAGAPT